MITVTLLSFLNTLTTDDVIFRRGNSICCLALTYFSAFVHVFTLVPPDLRRLNIRRRNRCHESTRVWSWVRNSVQSAAVTQTTVSQTFFSRGGTTRTIVRIPRNPWPLTIEREREKRITKRRLLAHRNYSSIFNYRTKVLTIFWSIL